MENDNSAAIPIYTGALKIIIFQFIITLVICLYFYFSEKSILWIYSALFGGGMAVFNTAIMHRGVRNAAEISRYAPGKEIFAFYAGGIQRFIFATVFFIIGMTWLQLEPVALILGFSLAQLAFLVADSAKRHTSATLNNKFP